MAEIDFPAEIRALRSTHASIEQVTDVDALRAEIAELSDEQLEQIAGGYQGTAPHPAKQIAAIAGITTLAAGALGAAGYGIYRLASHKHHDPQPQPSAPVNPNAPRQPRPWQIGGEQEPRTNP